MNRLIFALAVAPVLIATGAQAQTVTDEIAKSLWCGQAFTVLFASEKATIPTDQMAQFNAYVDAAGKLTDKASQDYVTAGFTQDQVDKLKADLVTEVTPVVTTGATGKYGPDDCNPLLGAYLTLPSQPSDAAPASAAPASDAPATSTAPAPDMSSSAAQ